MLFFLVGGWGGGAVRGGAFHKQLEAALFKFQKPLVPHAAQLVRHRAAVHEQEVREILPVQRNGERAAARLVVLRGEIVLQALARRAADAVLELAREVLPRARHGQRQVLQKADLRRGRQHVLAQELVHAEEQDLRLRRGRDGHVQAVAPHGIQFAQRVARAEHVHQIAVAVCVDVRQVHAAGQNHPDLREFVAVLRHHRALCVLHPVRRHRPDHAEDLLVGQIAEQHPRF